MNIDLPHISSMEMQSSGCTASQLVSAPRGFDYSVELLEPNVGLPALASTSDERAARWEAVLLLGDRDAVAAARAWHQAVYHLEWCARGLLTDHAQWPQIVAAA